jgi:ribosomal protein S18 acetylase RimI-like enzyme
MDIHIFPAQATDLDDVLMLLTRQFEEHGIELPAAQLRAAVQTMLADPRLGLILLACAGTEAHGLACLSFCWTLEHGGKSAWLDELYVLPQFRSQGIGKALLEATLKYASEQGCAAIDLEVDREHRRAESLYQRAGFEALPRSRWVKDLLE